MLEINLRAYLARLEADELAKPESQRRAVPSVPELANEIGVSRVQLYRLVGGQVQNFNLETAGRLMDAMNHRGFPMTVSDLLVYRKKEPPAAPADSA